MYPAARLRRGMVSPSPRTGGSGAYQQRRRCQAALGARSARGEQLAPRSRRPASAAQSTLQAVLRGDAAPPFRPLGPPPRPRPAASAQGRSPAAPSSGESARRAFAGPSDRRSGAPPFLPHSPASPTSFPPPSLLRSPAPSPSLHSPPPLTERLPYKIYESALSSRCGAPSYSQGRGARPRGAASQGVFAPPAPGDDPRSASVPVPALGPWPVVGTPRKPLPSPGGFSELAPAAQPPPARPSPMEVTQPGGWKRALCRLTGTRLLPPSPPVPSPHPCPSPLWPVPLPTGRLDGSDLPRTAPADPAAPLPVSHDTILFEGRCGVPPQAGPRPCSKHWGGPVANPGVREEPMWGLRWAIFT